MYELPTTRRSYKKKKKTAEINYQHAQFSEREANYSSMSKLTANNKQNAQLLWIQAKAKAYKH